MKNQMVCVIGEVKLVVLDWLSLVLAVNHSFLPKKNKKKNPKKVRSRKKNVPSVKENNVHSVPESDAENENKNATVSCNIE